MGRQVLLEERNDRVFSQTFLEKLSKSVENVESVSSVELVIVAAGNSGNYRDIDRQTGFLAAIAILLVAIHSPLEFAPEMLVFWMTLAYFLGSALSERLPWMRRLFLSSKRRKAEVEFSSRYYFHEKKLTHTRERTGLMLYLSHFERKTVLLPDVGVEAKLSGAVLHQFEHECNRQGSIEDFEKAVLEGLDSLKAPIGEALPRPDDDENELPNEVCVVIGGAR